MPVGGGALVPKQSAGQKMISESQRAQHLVKKALSHLYLSTTLSKPQIYGRLAPWADSYLLLSKCASGAKHHAEGERAE